MNMMMVMRKPNERELQYKDEILIYGTEDAELINYEAYVLSENKEDFLGKLIPGTDTFYFFTLLHVLTIHDPLLSEDNLTNLEAYKALATDKYKSIHIRQLLLRYDNVTDPLQKKEIIDTLLSKYLQFNFNYTKPSYISSTNLNMGQEKLATIIDEKEISFDTFIQNVYSNAKSLQKLSVNAYSRLDIKKIMKSGIEIIQTFLSKADLGSLEHIPELLAEYLVQKRKVSPKYNIEAFIYEKLTLDQMKTLENLIPEVRKDKNFISELFIREFPSFQENIPLLSKELREIRHAELIKAYEWSCNLPNIFESFQAQILHETLNNGIFINKYHDNLFLEYLKLPIRPYNSPSEKQAQILKTKQGYDSYWHNIHWFKTNEWIPVDQLIKCYLKRSFKSAESIEPYDEYLDVNYLKELYYEAKLIAGQSVPEATKTFSVDKLKELQQSKILNFCKWNKEYFRGTEEVYVWIELKNIPHLVIKVFELCPENYYKKTLQPLDGAINLDGLVPLSEGTFDFKEPPIVSILQEFRFDECEEATQGIFIIELLGNGLSSRLVIRKGRLLYLQRDTPEGQILTLINEDNQICAGEHSGIWIQNIFYKTNDAGEILIPYVASKRTEKVILVHNNYAELSELELKTENYEFRFSYIHNDESMLMGNKAKIILQPKLYLNGTNMSLDLLKNQQIIIMAVNDCNIPTTTIFDKIKFSDIEDYVIEFPLPAKVQNIHITVKGTIKLTVAKESDTLINTNNIKFSTYDHSYKFCHAYLRRSIDGYEVYILGKNGEPKPNMNLIVKLMHDMIEEYSTYNLQTDKDGKINLGQLKGFNKIYIEVKESEDIQRFSNSWIISEKRKLNYPNIIKIPENEDVILPVLDDELTNNKFKFVKIVATKGRPITNLFSNLKIMDMNLVISGLTEGEYELTIKDIPKMIKIIVVKGSYWAHKPDYILTKDYLYQVQQDSNSIAIRRTEFIPQANPELCTLKIHALAKNNNATRFHVFAYQYMPSNINAFADCLMETTMHPLLATLPLGLKRSIIINNRVIGDEYAYVLDRISKERHMGNTLEKPSILLKKIYTKDTRTIRMNSSSGEQFKMDNALLNELSLEEQQLKQDKKRWGSEGNRNMNCPSSVDTFLNFLENPAFVLVNLKIGVDNTIEIPNFPWRLYSSVQIIATNPWNAISHVVPLPSINILCKDLRLKSQLKKDSFYSIARGTSIKNKGQKFEVVDLASTEFQIVDSLSKLFNIQRQLRIARGFENKSQEGYDIWSFLANWDSLSYIEKIQKYDRYASHELNIFLYFKDHSFFKAIVKPFIINKIVKTFVDHFLLDNLQEILDYATPEKLMNLNSLEKVLLIIALRSSSPNDASFIAQAMENEQKLIAIDSNNYKTLFETVLNLKISEAKDQTQKSLDNVSKQKFPQKKSQVSEGYYSDYDRNQGNSNYRLSGQDKNTLMAGFQDLDQIKEYAEMNYYYSADSSITKNLIPLSQFWVDAAKHMANKGPDSLFLSPNFIYSISNHIELIGVLSLIGLPFAAGDHKYSPYQSRGTQIQAESSLIIFHKEIEEGSSDINGNILITQRFFNPNDRYTVSEDDPSMKMEKNVEEYLVNKIYGCQVIITNCSVSNKELQVLIEIPEGSIPVYTPDYTKSHTMQLNSYMTDSIEIYFYFPFPGKFPVYPASVSINGKAVAISKETLFDVKIEKGSTKLETLNDILTKGSLDDVLNFAKTKNIWNDSLFNFNSIYWLLKNKDFFLNFIDILRQRKIFIQKVWEFGFYHNDHQSISEYFRSEYGRSYTNKWFKHIDTSLMQVNQIKLLEYYPLVNSRVHLLSKGKSNIFNIEFKQQYKAFLMLLAEIPKLKTEHLIPLVYYLLLQDRLEEAIRYFNQINKQEVEETKEYLLQYDYISAFLDFYIGYPHFKIARQICGKYIDYPILEWKRLFIEVANQLAEYDGEILIEGDENNLDNKNDKGVKNTEKQGNLSIKLEENQILILYENISHFTINIYEINLEILFSRNPFLKDSSADFSFIKPNFSQKIEVKKSSIQEKSYFQIPEKLEKSNLFIQVITNGPSNSIALTTYFSTSLKVNVIESYGQVKVVDNNNRPLARVYIKCFAKTNSDEIKFYKDGYTDLRGRFDYATLNATDLTKIRKFAILVNSDELGSLIKEANPPSTLQRLEVDQEMPLKAKNLEWQQRYKNGLTGSML